MLKLHPKNVAITPIHDPDISPEGIIIPAVAKGRCDQGIVKYVGSQVPDYIQPGMYVIFSGYAGTLVNIEGEGTFIITRHHTIAAIIPEVQNVEVPGLYFKGANNNGEYFPANYEIVVNLIARAFQNTEMNREIGKNFFVPREMDWRDDE